MKSLPSFSTLLFYWALSSFVGMLSTGGLTCLFFVVQFLSATFILGELNEQFVKGNKNVRL